MQNDPKPAPNTSGAEATEREHPAASEIPTPGTGPESDPAFGPGPAQDNPSPEDTPPAALRAILAGMQQEKNGVHVETFCGHPVEIASDIIARIGLCPRDLVTLATALLCTVSERARDDWPVGGNPFHKIDMERLTPFQIAAQVLLTVDSWGNDGEYPPEETLQPQPASAPN